jgi:hypothetical protein
MASSTRGGKRGSKPKRKALKMYKTPGGAMQYGTPDGFRKAGAAVKNDLYDDKEFNAYDTALAGWAGAMSEKHGADAFSKRMERRAQERVQERKNKSVQNKKYGGKVQKMKEGGAAFPDLTGDGKVTRADILKGRGVKGFKYGGKVGGCRGGGAAMAGTKFTGCK